MSPIDKLRLRKQMEEEENNSFNVSFCFSFKQCGDAEDF